MSKKISIDDVLTSHADPTKLFDLLEEIAVGSYGHVYKAIYKPSDEIVALKIIALEEDDTFEEMMIEIQVLEKCVDNSNIVRYFGSWKKGEELFIAMELCEGGSANDLYQILERPLSEPQIAWITQETLKGLDYLHGKGIIHRDIKAANILLTSGGGVKLTDFGVSAQMENPQDKRRTFIGTPYWIAPEVVNTVIAPYDEKCDVWSLGITCIELAELQPPLHEIAPMTAVMQIPKNPPPTLQCASQWSPEFNDFLRECFIKDPNKRKSCKELLQHPFFAGLENEKGSVLVPLIRATQEAEAAFLLSDPTMDGNESEDFSDTDEAYDSPVVSRRNGTVNGDEDEQSPPKKKGSLRAGVSGTVDFAKMTEEEKRNALHAERKQKAKALEQSKQDARPTITRTLKKDNAPKQVVKKKIVRAQVKQLKKLMKQHEQGQQRQLKQHEQEVEALQQSYQSSIAAKHKELAKKQRKLRKSHLADAEELKRNHATEVKQLQRQHETDRRKVQRDIREDQTKAKKNFKVEQAEKKSVFQETKKQYKRKKSGDVKALEATFKADSMHEQLCFNHRIAMEELRKENDVLLYQQRQMSQKLREQQSKEMQNLMKQFIEMQEFKIKVLSAQQELEKKMQDEEMELEMKHLDSQQTLQKEQVMEHHKLLFEQQQRQQAEEERLETRKFKQMQKKQTKEWGLRMKAQKTDRNTRRSKAQQHKKELQRAEVAFLQGLLESRKQMEADTHARQRDQIEILNSQHENAKKHLKSEHKERVSWLVTKHTKQMRELVLQQWEERDKYTKDDHCKQLELIQKQEDELLASLREVQQLEIDLQNRQDDELAGRDRILVDSIINTVEELEETHKEQEKKTREEFVQIQAFALKTHDEELGTLFAEKPIYDDMEEEETPVQNGGGDHVLVVDDDIDNLTKTAQQNALSTMDDREDIEEYKELLGTLRDLASYG